MQHNVIRNGDTLTVDTFMDLNKYFNSVVTMSPLDNMHNDGGIHKLIIKNSKCSLTIDAVRCFLTNPILDNLKEIDIITEDERFCSVEGLLCSRNKCRLYFCPRGIDGILAIPAGTNTITENACSNCGFSKIIIPDSVKRIDRYAFIRNYALEYVDGCKNVERIGDYAFAYCKQLKKFQFGEFVKNIGAAAFCDTMLTEIYLPEGLARVGRQAFNTTCVVNGIQTLVEASRMYDIHIPSTLKYIESCAFANAANVYSPFVNAALIQACMRSGNLQHCHECNIWRLKIEDNPDMIVPKSIKTTKHASIMASEINTALRMQSKHFQTSEVEVDEATPPELHQYGSGSTSLTAALEQCRKYPSGSLRRFITQNTTPIFENLVCNPFNKNGKEILISLIKDNVFTDTALKKFLNEIEKSGNKEEMTTVKAYVLDAIGHKLNKFNV